MPETLRIELMQKGSLTFTVKVRSGAAKSQVKGKLADGTWKVDIAAAPEDGKANVELIAFLAETFAVPRANIKILSGFATSRKRVRLTVVNP